MGSRVFDVAVLGGGIVGAATALTLSKQVKSLVLLEAEGRMAAHQTGNNSGVIHSGLYYRPGSLKAENCVTGREDLYRFCQEHDIAHDQCGKLVVATRQDELPKLEDLENRGRGNGLEGLKHLTGDQLKEYEPHVTGIAGLFVPQTGIVDYVAVAETFARIVQEGGGEIHLNSRVLSCWQKNGQFALETSQGPVHCKNLVNCCGLQSDRVTKLCGESPGIKIIPFRGEYYELIPEKRGLINNLIYPVPDPQFPFLGVHFTRMIDGGVEAGPNAVLAFKREGYTKTAFSLRDVVDFTCYKGFWIMGMKHWKMGFGEFYRSFSKAAFVKALQRLIPEITSEDLVPGGAGVRAQALEPNGFLLDDFRIIQSRGMIHVLNAPSPAATASISIGRKIAQMAQDQFQL